MLNPTCLRRSENEYELKIRGLSTSGNADKLRSRLSQALVDKVEIKEEYLKNMDVEVELEVCEEKFHDLSKLAEDYEGNTKDNEFRRLSARLLHLYQRVERIPVDEEEDDEAAAKRSGLLQKTKSLFDDFLALPSKMPKRQNTSEDQEDKGERLKDDKKTSESISVEPVAEEIAPGETTKESVRLLVSRFEKEGSRSKPTTTTVSSIEEKLQLTSEYNRSNHQPLCMKSEATKSVPDFKWGLQFSNSPGQSIGAFLQRVEELRRARGITEIQLFRSAVDLFTGNALIWYRSTVGRISS